MKTILETAEEIVSGPRQKFYGHPLDNHGNIAIFWSLYIRKKYGANVELNARDVCFMMMLKKISRDTTKEDRENIIDIAGYSRNAEMIEDERYKRGKEAKNKSAIRRSNSSNNKPTGKKS